MAHQLLFHRQPDIALQALGRSEHVSNVIFTVSHFFYDLPIAL